LARRILYDYHPGEPEMWLTLSAAKFPTFFMGGTLSPVLPPLPDVTEKPQFVVLYETCEWRKDLCLLEFLRRSNAAGEPLAWIKKKHAASGSDLSLGDFACTVPISGEKIIAAEYVSKLSDRYFGQWLAMHHPFRDLRALLPPAVVQCVPDKHKYLACALHFCGEYWTNEARVRQDLALEAHTLVAPFPLNNHSQMCTPK
jgi:hypothetical protein